VVGGGGGGRTHTGLLGWGKKKQTKRPNPLSGARGGEGTTWGLCGTKKKKKNPKITGGSGHPTLGGGGGKKDKGKFFQHKGGFKTPRVFFQVFRGAVGKGGGVPKGCK